MQQNEVKVRKNLPEIITHESVKAMGEILTISAFKGFSKYWHTEDFDILYKGLLRDIYRTPESAFNFSDGYDLAQNAICFLCEHFGRNISDVLYVDKKGKSITIKIACLRIVARGLSAKQRRKRQHVCIDELYSLEAPKAAEANTEESYDAVEETIKRMELTADQRNALSCRMSGLSYPEAAKLLLVATSTVWDRMSKVREKYNRKILGLC